jgi:hypothetical protein
MTSGAGIASHRVVHPGTPRPAPCTTKSWSRPPASSPARGPAPSTSMLMELSDALSAPGSSRTCASYKRVVSLPSCVGLASTSHTCGIDASCADSPGTSVPWGTATSREELEGPRRGHRAHNVPMHDRSCRGTTPATHGSPFKFRDRNRRNRSNIDGRQLHAHTEMSPAERTKGGLSWTGTPLPLDPTRTASPSYPWQPR